MDTYSAVEMYKKDIEELDKLIGLSQRPNVKRQLEEIKTNLTRLMEEEKKKIELEKKEKEQSTTEKKDADEKKENKEDNKIDINKLNISFNSINKYALDTSSDKFVKVYLTDGFDGIKEFNSKNIQSKFTNKSFDICIIGWKNKNFRFSCFNLSKDINPSDSYVKQTNSGLIVYLAKANKSDFWDSLEKKKNLFGKSDDESPLKKDADPNESLMNMMRDMYQNGDPEMKKMIAEAWTKSREETDKMKK